ncbi:MAG: anti-sigma factor [Pseudonocardia sp.]
MNARHALPGDDDREVLGAYVLGLAEADEARAVENRLAVDAAYRREMEELREMTELLGEVPPEALLDGPPDGDLVLQRTLRQIRTEDAFDRRRRFTGLVAVAAVAAAVVLGGGVLVGRATAPAETVLAQPAPPAAGGRVLSGGGGGVAMTATLTPAAGWVRVAVAVAGIEEGERCRIVVVSRDGRREIAGSWVVSAAGAQNGTMLDGSASVAPDDIAAVVVENEAGRQFATLPA